MDGPEWSFYTKSIELFNSNLQMSDTKCKQQRKGIPLLNAFCHFFPLAQLSVVVIHPKMVGMDGHQLLYIALLLSVPPNLPLQ